MNFFFKHMLKLFIATGYGGSKESFSDLLIKSIWSQRGILKHSFEVHLTFLVDKWSYDLPKYLRDFDRCDKNIHSRK